MRLPALDTSRAVLIGAHTFRDLPPLGPVEANVNQLKQLLTSGDLWGLAPEHCLDQLQPANPGDVLDDLHRAAAEATDTLVVYYAGHGITDPGDERQLYLALPDSAPTGQWYRTLRYADVREAVAGSPAVHKVVIIDCCFSGLALDGGMGPPPDSGIATQVIAARADIDKTCVLTASAGTVKALCPPGETYSAFTGELIAVLERGLAGPVPGDESGPPGEHRPVLDLGSVYRALHSALRVKGRPLPQLGTRNLGGEIALARNRAYAGPEPHGSAPWLPRLDTLEAPREVFVGREEELRRLIDVAQEVARAGGGPGVCVVHGMGGVGKSELLRQATAEVAAQFDDARFEIDLAGFTPQRQPRDPDQVITEHLQLIGYQPAEVPTDPAARERAWRTWLSGRRTLLLLDNAKDAEQVRPLLPGPRSPSLVLISSRDRLDAIDTRLRLYAAGLRRGESIALLCKTSDADANAGAGPGELAEIAARCCDLPVALRPVGALLRDMPAPAVLADMRQENPLAYIPDGYQAVQQAFTTSYEALPDDLQVLLWHCAWHPGPDFGRDSIAAMAPQPAVGIGLTRLLQRNLLVTEGDRLSFHDLFRNLALAAAEPHAPALRTEARQRLYRYLAQRLLAASIAIFGMDGDIDESLAGGEFTDPGTAEEWLRQRSDELQAAAGDALEERWKGAGLLVIKLTRWLRFTHQVAQARTLSRKLLSAATAIDDRNAQAGALVGIADTHYMRDDYAAARDLYQQALDLARATGDRNRKADALIGIARTYYWQDDDGRAGEFYQRALGLARATGDRIGQAIALIGVADAHRMRDDSEQAGESYQQALNLARVTGDRNRQADALIGIADTHRMLEEYGQARVLHQRALDLARTTGDRNRQGTALTGIARTYRMQEDYRLARDFYRQALELAYTTGDRIGQADALIGVARTHLMQNDYERAGDFYWRALDLARMTHDRIGQTDALNGIAETHYAQGDFGDAHDFYEQALDLARVTGDRTRQAIALTGIGDVGHAAGHGG